MSVIERVDGLEQRTRSLEARLAALEDGESPSPAPRLAPPSLRSRRAPPRPLPSAAAPTGRASRTCSAGAVLAWAGGLTLFAGLLFLLVIAVSRGWIGEEARTALAAATSLALLALGVRTYERRGRTDSALAATAAGIAGLFASVIVAAQVYELIPAPAGLVIAFAVAATATWLAIRWEAPGIAALGILGAVLAPALVGADLSLVLTGFLFAATASAVGVLVWQRWTWLAFATFGVATQWVAWIVFEAAWGDGGAGRAARLRRPRRRRGRRVRAAHPQRQPERHLARPCSCSTRSSSRRWAGSRCRRPRATPPATSGSAPSRSRTSPSPSRASGSHASRTSSPSRRPPSASCSRMSRSPRRSTASRSSPAGRRAASRWPALARAATNRLDGGFALTGLGAHLGLGSRTRWSTTRRSARRRSRPRLRRGGRARPRGGGLLRLRARWLPAGPRATACCSTAPGSPSSATSPR